MTALEQITMTLQMLVANRPADDPGRIEAERQISEARKEQAELIGILRGLQWSKYFPDHEGGGGSVFACCPECYQQDLRGHKATCDLGKVLAKHVPH
jgi:hypothetical protein